MSTKVSQCRRVLSTSVALLVAATIALGLGGLSSDAHAKPRPKFRVLAFYTAKHDLAHISFVNEANRWFPLMAARHNFHWESTKNWDDLNPETLRKYQVVMFLDTRPEEEHHRRAFQQFMERGGAFMGFHFAGFALTPSKYPQNWTWYHDDFLGVGQYKSNTWRPTAAILRVERRNHPVTAQLPETFKSSP
ncbi:MAG TPA: ThuA domain-containing protein, partial [Polyangia bacterium]